MTLFASLFPIACWLLYNYCVPFVERRQPSLSSIMTMQRRRWVANATRRESPLDAILSGNLMQSVSLLASTSVLIILAIFAAFGAVPADAALAAAVADAVVGAVAVDAMLTEPPVVEPAATAAADDVSAPADASALAASTGWCSAR